MMLDRRMRDKGKLIIPVLSISVLTAVFLISSTDYPVLVPLVPIPILSPPEAVGFLVHTPACRIPLMDPADTAVKKYIQKPKPLECFTSGPFVLANQTSIWVNTEAILANNLSIGEVSCCHQAIWRGEPNKGAGRKADENIKGWVDCTEFEGSTHIYDEFIRVLCHSNGTQVYKDYFAFIVPKNNDTANHVDGAITKEKLSVLMIGIDAVSRLNFYRQMPKTLEYLHSKKAIELLGYNKVDDNTFPNLVPVLTGSSIEELRQTCWKKDSDYFDDCNFVWKDFKRKKFMTGFGEDACWMGLFQYLKSGFFEQPTDYYLHTLMSTSESELGRMHKMNADLCIGERFAAQVLFNYAENFAVNLTHSNQPYFGFFWGTSLTHDFLNVLPQTDEIYFNLLRNLEVNGVLNSTVVILLSDHGIRWGPIRETYQGRVEERLPLVFFLTPDWFHEAYPGAMSNLRRNRKMLTSPFDIYETLVDLSDISSALPPAKLSQRMRLQGKGVRGTSLFLPVPETRTCEDAGITDNWCTCHQSQNVSLENPIVKKSAQSVVDFINEKLFSYIQCAQLTLDEIINAQMESPRTEVQSSTKMAIQDVTVLLVTVPGKAKFEATVRHHIDSGVMQVLGYVSRINTYGDQSKCVQNFHMRLYCFCT